MANFPTHIAVGTVVSGALATVTVAADMVAPGEHRRRDAGGRAGLGAARHRPQGLAARAGRCSPGSRVFFSFAVLFSLERKYSIAEMLILWLGTLVFVRYVGKEIFFRFSYHRGIWHSLLATVFCAFLTAWIYSTLLGRDAGVAWLAAGFMAIGYPHPPDPRRDLLRRRDGHAHQGLVRHGAEAGRLQAPGAIPRPWRSPPCWSSC